MSLNSAKKTPAPGKEKKRLFGLKKRMNFYDNEVMKIEKSSSFAPLGYGDRFIPRRYSKNTLGVPTEAELNDILMSHKNTSWKRLNFATVFSNLFDIESKKDRPTWSHSRILSFKDDIAKHFSDMSYQFYWAPEFSYVLTPKWYKNLDWPCVPRSKSLSFMETVHSINGLHKSGKKKLIVWTATNKIVAFVRPEIITWTPGSSNLMVYSLDLITALAFDRKGIYMAAGGKLAQDTVLEIWKSKKLNIDLKSLIRMKDRSDDIRCLVWSEDGHDIVCGQKSGSLTIHHARDLSSPCLVLSTRHTHAICDIKFSVDYKLFAVTDESGMVTVWKWMFNYHLFKLNSPWNTAIFIDWHPWCPTEFVIASQAPASIGIVNTVEKNVVGWYKRCDNKCRIDAITFNKLSGELVVAYQRQSGPNNTMETEIVVLASLEHVSDVLRKNKMNRIYHMMWSPDGKRLATAGSLDDLTLWNFFGRSEVAMQKCAKKHKVNKQPTSELSRLAMIR
ncbi:protein cortex [Lutzomyia longipalpis]|uniref:protein cortex n=1 Tax=Lutzomyia longipalpis TaxID=7200 RepID=UPI0024846DAC|nr:protein cortex [Lutzomyia longipalpis]